MDLGLDPVFHAWVRSDGWGLITMAVHIPENPFKAFTEQR